MHLVLRRFNGLSLLYTVNADRLLAVATVLAGLLAGAWIANLLVALP